MAKFIVKSTLILAFVLGTLPLMQAQESKDRIVEMTNEATYNPAELIIQKGERIVWKNTSDQVQTITVKTQKQNDRLKAMAPDEAEPFSSGAIRPGETFAYTFYIPGTYEIVSLPNATANMSGRIIVQD